MKTTELQKRTIFSTRKRENLELKFEQAYQASKEEATHHSKNVAHLIQAAVVVMVRNAFYVGDFSYLAKNLIRKIFLEGEVPASVRHLCIYFEDYFTQEEWQLVISHLYKNQKEYHQLTEETRLHIKPLRPALTSGVQIGERKLNLKASFLDEKNKMHTWSLSNVVACLTTKERIDLLNIFGELTIFQKDGLRQFTEVVWVDFAIDERFRDFDVRNEEDPFHKPKESAQNQPKEAPVNKQSTKNPCRRMVSKKTRIPLSQLRPLNRLLISWSRDNLQTSRRRKRLARHRRIECPAGKIQLPMVKNQKKKRTLK